MKLLPALGALTLTLVVNIHLAYGQNAVNISYQLPKCGSMGNLLSRSNECWGSIQTYDGDYEGEIRDGVPRGTGTFKLHNGAIYTGEVRGGPSGVGIITYPDGSRYSGHVSGGGRPDGRGTKVTPKGDIFDGNWDLGTAHGAMSIHYVDGGTFEGTYARGRRVSGTRIWANGQKFSGIWDGNAIKEGELTTPQKGENIGGRYIGSFKSGKADGAGKIYYTDGTIYDGEFRLGEREGYGILYRTDRRPTEAGHWLGDRLIEAIPVSEVARYIREVHQRADQQKSIEAENARRMQRAMNAAALEADAQILYNLSQDLERSQVQTDAPQPTRSVSVPSPVAGRYQPPPITTPSSIKTYSIDGRSYTCITMANDTDCR